MSIVINTLYYIIPFIVLLGILVFVHEYGHFIVARILKVTVTDFSIGFGKTLWSRKDKKGTNWKVSAIPLGGYCQFLGDADASSSTVADMSALSAEEKAGAFPLQKPWKKLLIALAGPVFNYLLAIVIFIALFYSIGRMVFPPVVGEVIADGAAARAGIVAGDKIVKINGADTPDFNAISTEVSLADQDNITVMVERPMSAELTAEEMAFSVNGENKKERIIGLLSLPVSEDNPQEAAVPTVVGNVVTGSAADKAGFLRGDKLVSVNDVPLNSFDDLKNYVSEHLDEVLHIQYVRPLEFNVTLRDTEYDAGDGEKVKRKMLGVLSSQELSFEQTDMSFVTAVKAGFVEAYDLTANTLRAVGQMVTGRRGGKDVGGVIRIAEMSGDISKKGGIISFIYFLALLSVNLGLINLLPIPVLDGGSVVIYLLEMITGREMNAKFKDWIFKFGLLIILAIMVLATWNDVVHLISRWFD